MAEREFKLPDLGEGLTDGEVVRWLVAEGERHHFLNQPIVEIETAKAVVEILAPYAGTGGQAARRRGEFEVGAPLISVDTGGESGQLGGWPLEDRAVATAPSEAAVPDAQQELQATLVGPGERQQTRRRRIGGHARTAGGPVATTTASAKPAALRPRRPRRCAATRRTAGST